jgi:hypothetical protein
MSDLWAVLIRRARLIDLGAHFIMHGAHSLLHP